MERVTVDQAQAMMRDNIKVMRKVYTTMRDIAQKRIKRMGQTEFSQSKTYQTNKEGFKKLKDIDPRDFAKAFSELSKFVTAKGSTVTGQRAIQAKTMGTLNRAIGATDEEDEEGELTGAKVTKENYWRVIKILDEARRQKVTYDSEKIVSLADTTLSFTDDQFDDVLDKLDKMLSHSDELEGSLNAYMKKLKIKNYQVVNVDDFIEQIGW